MNQDAFSALALPLLFAMAAGIYGFQRFPERRQTLLLNLVLFQLLGAYAVHQQPSAELLGLLSVFALVVCSLLVRHLQSPQPAPALQAEQAGRRR